LIAAMRYLKDRYNVRATLLIAGRPPKTNGFDPYARDIRTLGLEADVLRHIERVPENQVGMYYSAADVVALPYERTFQAQSGVLFDAYAYGVPVVATDVGAIGETVRGDGTGIVVASGEPMEFARALSELLANRRLRRAATARMRELANGRYSWEAVGAQTRGYYDSIEVARPRKAAIAHPKRNLSAGA